MNHVSLMEEEEWTKSVLSSEGVCIADIVSYEEDGFVTVAVEVLPCDAMAAKTAMERRYCCGLRVCGEFVQVYGELEAVR